MHSFRGIVVKERKSTAFYLPVSISKNLVKNYFHHKFERLMILQFQKSQIELFFLFRDIQLNMTEPPSSSELETVAVESTAIYLMYEVKTTDCTK